MREVNTPAQARLKFTTEHPKVSEKAWERELWSDEPKIELFGINWTRWVWRKKNAEYDPKNNIHTVKIGGEYMFFLPRVQDDFILSSARIPKIGQRCSTA